MRINPVKQYSIYYKHEWNIIHPITLKHQYLEHNICKCGKSVCGVNVLFTHYSNNSHRHQPQSYICSCILHSLLLFTYIPIDIKDTHNEHTVNTRPIHPSIQSFFLSYPHKHQLKIFTRSSDDIDTISPRYRPHINIDINSISTK